MTSSSASTPTNEPRALDVISNYAHCSKCGKEDPMMSLKWCPNCHAVKHCNKGCQRADWVNHKPNCKNQNYILKAQLEHHSLAEPMVRTLSCPSYASFEDLDRALKIAFQCNGKQKGKEYAFVVWNPLWRTAAWRQWKDVILQRVAASKSSVYMMGPETNMHVGPIKLRMVEAKSWVEFPTPTAEAFNKLPWMKQHNCWNDLPSESRTVGRILEDERFFCGTSFKDIKLSYRYDLDAGADFKHTITPIMRSPPTKVFACLDGSFPKADRDTINQKLASLPVRGVKHTLSAGYRRA